MPRYSVLLTRDSTESAHVKVEADSKEEALDLALQRDDVAWTPNDFGCNGGAYLGDCVENDVQEIESLDVKIGDRITFRALTRHNSAKATRIVNGFYTYGDLRRPTVRFEGTAQFIVRRREILAVNGHTLT